MEERLLRTGICTGGQRKAQSWKTIFKTAKEHERTISTHISKMK
jgi:ferritin